MWKTLLPDGPVCQGVTEQPVARPSGGKETWLRAEKSADNASNAKRGRRRHIDLICPSFSRPTASLLDRNLAVMDRKLIMIGNGKSRVEFCKRPGKSS